MSEIPEIHPAVDADLDALFWPSPQREERFLKFCLFQSLFTGGRPPPRVPAAVPVELRGYTREQGLQVYTRIASLNAKEPGSAADYNYAAAAAFYAAVLVPEKSELTELALQFYRTGVETFPGNLVLRFNAACMQWSVGLKGEASANFMTVIDEESELEFDATKDALISHRVRAISNLFPFGDYHAACAGHDSGGANPRSILKCAAMTFLGADALDEGRLDQAIELLEEAALLFGRSAPVWRLLARARLAGGSGAAAVRGAFYRAVNLYPGELPGLLKIGLEAELADGRSEQAADILRKWTLVAARVTSEDGQGYGISPENLLVAETHRGLLQGWTRDLLDRILRDHRE